MRPPIATRIALFAALAAPAFAQETLFSLSGPTGDSWGQVCDVVGDLNNDGFGEVMVGAWRDNNGALGDAGSVKVYNGADGMLLTTLFGTGTGDHVGYGSSSAGDMNNDGFMDVLVAGDEDNVAGGNNVGSARVFSGVDFSLLYTMNGEDPNDLFGWSTAAIGDANADGFDDVAISSLLAEGSGTPSNGGSVSCYSGADGLLLWRTYGSVANGQLGSNVGRAGDVNNDGLDDVVAVQNNLVRVLSGLDGAEIRVRTFGGTGNGLKVSGGIDVDLDGFDDWLVGASAVTSNSGRVQVISGLTNMVMINIFGDNTGDLMGASIVGAGDLNGDGYGDFAAGMPGWDGGGTGSGAIRAWSGLDFSEIFTINGNAAGDQIGSAIGGFRDVNGDGYPDVISTSVSDGKAIVVSFIPDGLEPFGTGNAGCDGEHALMANGVPALGNAAWTVHTTNSSSPAVLWISTVELTAGVPVMGLLLHAAPAGLVSQVTLPAPDANGTILRALPVPNDMSLLGPTYVFQALNVWPGDPCGTPFSGSRGLRVTLQ